MLNVIFVQQRAARLLKLHQGMPLCNGMKFLGASSRNQAMPRCAARLTETWPFNSLLPAQLPHGRWPLLLPALFRYPRGDLGSEPTQEWCAVSGRGLARLLLGAHPLAWAPFVLAGEGGAGVGVRRAPDHPQIRRPDLLS
jgi:hypothetical protein